MKGNYTIQHYTVLNRFARLCTTLSTDRQQQLESTALHAHYKLPQSYNYCRALRHGQRTPHISHCVAYVAAALTCSLAPRGQAGPLMQHTCTQRRSLLTPTYYTHHVTHCRRRENGSLHYTTCRDATPSLRHLLLTHYWRVCSSAVRLPAAPRRSRRHSCKTRNASCNTPEVVSSALATCATHFARHMPRLAARRWLSQLAPWALCCAEALCSTRPLLHTSVVVPLLSSAHAGRMVSNLGKSRLTLS